MSENQQDALTEFDRSELRVSLSYGELRAEFTGSPESVLESLVSFLAKQIPTLNLAQMLSLNYTLTELVEKFKDYLKITPEGPMVIAGSRLSDRELLCVRLVGQRIAFETRRARSSLISLSELQETTGMNPKTLSSRLSELSKEGCVTRESTSEGTMFKITTQGISWLIQDLSKKRSTKG